MAEVNWYYSHGEEQLGPLTASQLKKLAAAGKLAPADLVWKEGMDDWVAASSIDGLIPIAPPTDSPPEDATSEPPPTTAPVIAAQPRAAISTPRGRGVGRSIGGGRFTDLLGYARFVAYPALVFGLLLAMMSRGCDQLSSPGIQAADAKAKLAVQEFNNKRAREQRKHRDDPEALAEANEKLDEEEKKLKEGDWLDLQETADTVQLKYAVGAWWREMFFRFGTIVLTFGLLGVGLTGKGADRWVCLVILVIIIMNLYGSQLLVGFGGR